MFILDKWRMGMLLPDIIHNNSGTSTEADTGLTLYK